MSLLSFRTILSDVRPIEGIGDVSEYDCEDVERRAADETAGLGGERLVEAPLAGLDERTGRAERPFASTSSPPLGLLCLYVRT